MKDEALSFLDLEPLRNIALRKFLRFYDHQQIFLSRDSGGVVDGVAVLFETAQFGYDASHYPNCSLKLLLSTRSSVAEQQLVADVLAQVPASAPLLLKLLDHFPREHFEQRYCLDERCAFVSFTSAPNAEQDERDERDERDESLGEGIQSSAAVPDHCLPLLLANSYTQAEISHYFSSGSAHCFWWCADGVTLCACITYANEGDVHEIGALYTVPLARRQGVALRVVRAALAHLRGSGKQVRYQVRDDNLASTELARALGLTPFVRLAHIVATPR
jgi:GNAT superfamily N-acetyltransferase